MSTDEQRIKKREQMRKWRANNPEKVREIARNGRLRNLEKSRKATREYMRRVYAENPEKVREAVRKWYWENRDKIQERVREKRKKNPEFFKNRSREWAENNRDKTRGYSRKRRKEKPEEQRTFNRNRKARVRGATGRCSVKQVEARIAFYGGICAYCKTRPYEHVDHVIPLARGGTHWPANLRPACEKCNLSKTDKLLSEWVVRP